MNTEIEVKTERLVEMLVQHRIKGVLLNGQHNFAWITGGANNGIDRSRENGAASILITSAGGRYILANNIEMPRMIKEQVSVEDFEPIEYSWQAEKASGSYIARAAENLAGGEIAADLPMLSDLRAIDGLVSRCRYELTDDEIARYRTLGEDGGRAIERLVDKLTPGMTEIEIAVMLRSELAAVGIESVVTLTAADERIDKYRHPVPTTNIWKKALLLVTCAKRHGLVVSVSRMLHVGAVPVELCDITEAAAFVNARLQAATEPGISGADLYDTAARAYIEGGFSREINNHHQGGATGYRTREWVAHPAETNLVHSNQAFAWNPTITGTKVEDTTILAGGGIEIITPTPKFPTIVHSIDGRDHKSAGVLSISR